MSEKLSRIPTAALRAHTKFEQTDFDVFLPTASESGPVLYSKNAQGLSPKDIDRIEDSGVKFLYIRTDDFHACEESLEKRLAAILNSPDLDPCSKAVVAHSAGTSVARDLLTEPLSTESLGRTVRVVDAMMDSLLHEPIIAGHLLQMAGHERTTASHMLIVSSLAVAPGSEVFGPGEEELLKCLGTAGMLHDLGKLSVPEHILKKAGPLTRNELILLQQHPIESVRLINDDPTVSPLARQIILQHHERLDGRGYPLGLSEEEILTASKVLTIVDCFHAMIGRRTYRAAMDPAEANRILMTQVGAQFDGDILEVWINLCRQRARDRDRSGSQIVFDGSEGDDEIASRDEHKPAPGIPSVINRRPARHVCKGHAMVRCVYVGKLSGGTEASPEFSALVHDLSRSGICIFTASPMYRGEFINVRVQFGGGPIWIRSKVCWCKQTGSAVYKNGLQFLHKISEEESHDSVDMTPLEIGVETPPLPDEESTEPAEERVESSSDDRSDASSRLAAIASSGSRDKAAQQTVVTLAMAGETTVRLDALELLVKLNTTMTRDAIGVLVSDSNRPVRESAIIAAGTLRVRQAISGLQEALHSDDLTHALYAAESLGLMDDQSGLKLAAGTLAKNIPESRLAARVVGEITGHRFGANREGIKAVLRYLDAKKLMPT